MVNKAPVAMETLLGSNRPVQQGLDSLDLLTEALGLCLLVAFFAVCFSFLCFFFVISFKTPRMHRMWMYFQTVSTV